MAKYTVIVRERIVRRGEIEVEAADHSEALLRVKATIVSETIDMGVFDEDITPTILVDIVDIEEG